MSEPQAQAAEIEPYAGLSEEQFAFWRAKASKLAARLSATALECDRANANPVEEIGWLSETGLLGLAVPRALG